MYKKNFHFDLPKELIAQYPTSQRTESRLMIIDPQHQSIHHSSSVKEFLDFVDKESIIVVNNSRVRKARLWAISESGKRVEFFFLNPFPDGLWQVMVSQSKRQKIGKKYRLEGDIVVEIVSELPSGTKVIRSDYPLSEEFFERYGHVPLPPYIKRMDDLEDEDRYQNVFAKAIGSVAAPTAGLHFDEDLLSKIKEKSCNLLEVTLHVGLGTFEPLRTEVIEEHKMHSESYSLSSEVAQIINEAKKNGKKIIAIGTTTLRVLESSTDEKGLLRSGDGLTDIFIYPGYKFKIVDALFTNFHTPDSTLFLLACTFGGKDLVMKAYKEAIQKQYRFFSYGDATFFRNHIKS